MRTFVWSLFALAAAISDAEKSLAKFLVNRTEPADEPCFRAEFVVKVTKLTLTPAGKVTNLLSSFFSLEMAERSEAKSAKRSFASKI